MWDKLENLPLDKYDEYMEALDKIDILQKYISKIDMEDIADYLQKKNEPERIDDVEHNMRIFREGSNRIGAEILGWSYYNDLLESVPRYINEASKKHPLKFPNKEENAKTFASEITKPNNVKKYKKDIESIIKGTMALVSFMRIYAAVAEGVKQPIVKKVSREVILPKEVKKEKEFVPPIVKHEPEKQKDFSNVSKEAPVEFKKKNKNFIRTPDNKEFEYDFETKDVDGIVRYFQNNHEVYSYLEESKKYPMMKIPTLDEYIKINEDFYNPFDEDDEVEKKPRSLGDKGGQLFLRKETFNLSRVEFAKRPGGEYTVIAKTQFAKGEIVEICPVIILKEEAKTIDRLKDVIFELDRESNEWALVLGYGSLYKHDEKANIDYAYNRLTKQMYFITKRPIKQAEELTINYGQDYWMERMSFNTMKDLERTDNNQGMPVISGKAVTKKNESEIEPNAADIQNKTTAKELSSPNNPANPVRSGVAIIGGGQS